MCVLTQRHEGSSGEDLTLDPVVEFSSSAQQQVDPGAEGGISGQEQGGQSALCLCPHATQQLFEGKTGHFPAAHRANVWLRHLTPGLYTSSGLHCSSS